MRGRAELQSGAILLLGSAVALAVLKKLGTSPSPTGIGIVFTGQGFVTAVVAIILIGVFAIGALLLALGFILWLSQRARDTRTRKD